MGWFLGVSYSSWDETTQAGLGLAMTVRTGQPAARYASRRDCRYLNIIKDEGKAGILFVGTRIGKVKRRDESADDELVPEGDVLHQPKASVGSNGTQTELWSLDQHLPMAKLNVTEIIPRACSFAYTANDLLHVWVLEVLVKGRNALLWSSLILTAS